jgi:hypothetical protein
MKKLTIYTLSAILGIGMSYNAGATLSFTLHDEFSGGDQPLGSVKTDFTTIAPGTVDLTISSLLQGSEFMSEISFNLDPTLNPTSLAFALQSSSGGFLVPGSNDILTGVNAFQADGDGKYDILFDFAPPPGGTSNVFDNSESVTFRITGIATLTEDSFNFLSAPAGGHGPFLAAAHIQGVGPSASGSGWIAPNGGNGVPDGGTTVMLLGTALASLGALRRRFA